MSASSKQGNDCRKKQGKRGDGHVVVMSSDGHVVVMSCACLVSCSPLMSCVLLS